MPEIKVGHINVPRIKHHDEENLRRVRESFQRMSPEEMFKLAVDVGIYTEDGRLTTTYGGDALPPLQDTKIQK